MGMTPLLIAAGVAALVLLWGVVTFNALVRARNRVNESWSGVDVQLKRRRDLVPNLVQAVEAYPDLRASRGFGRLQTQLAEVEDDIVGARRIFNSNVQRYNDLVRAVPAAGIARMTGFRGRQYFDVETSAE